VTDNETNLAKWTAFARSSDPEAVGHTLNEMARRSTALEEALRVLAAEVDAWRYLADGAEDSSWSTAWSECGDDCSDAEEKTNANPIAAEAVRKAGG